jgi:DNA segregation ATPase FtsK/SpoIIIE-like protein
MDTSELARSLSVLRRELEEILAVVTNDVCVTTDERHQELDSLPIQPDVESDSSPTREANEPSPRDELFEDALVVITEFGQVSPAILQMWLSISYTRATELLNQFQTRGLVSPKGKVRHKAYELRKSMEFSL